MPKNFKKKKKKKKIALGEDSLKQKMLRDSVKFPLRNVSRKIELL